MAVYGTPTTQSASAEQLQAELKQLAGEIASSLTELDAARGKELLSDFVSELFLSVTEQQRRKERRQRQAEGIAEAKARGVRFGRPAPPLPDSFDQYHQAWRNGEMSLRQAAAACGMAQSSFHNAAMRREQSGDRAG